jgi:hypothetical protein
MKLLGLLRRLIFLAAFPNSNTLLSGICKIKCDCSVFVLQEVIQRLSCNVDMRF